jgi:hypothetical protein
MTNAFIEVTHFVLPFCSFSMAVCSSLVVERKMSLHFHVFVTNETIRAWQKTSAQWGHFVCQLNWVRTDLHSNVWQISYPLCIICRYRPVITRIMQFGLLWFFRSFVLILHALEMNQVKLQLGGSFGFVMNCR